MEVSPPSQRQLVKLAMLIHEQLLQSRDSHSDWYLPDYAWRCVEREHRRWQLATHKGWRHAQAVHFERLRQHLQMLQNDTQGMLNRLHAPPAVKIASPGEILNDLLALQDEFDRVTYEPKHVLLSVTTPPIVLEDLYLGPFRIELDLRKLTPHPSYLVIAEEPHRPERNDSVTHPHVEGDRLCEGEGTMMIRAAVQSGRLLDFFLIINNLLRTYNSASPYVAISEWDGAVCRECDYSMDYDDSRSCERCDITLCTECSRYCGDCSATVCSGCSRACIRCGEDVCRGCVHECSDCSEPVCPNCLQDEERCPTCHEIYLDEKENQPTDTSLQSICVGEAALSAGPR